MPRRFQRFSIHIEVHLSSRNSLFGAKRAFPPDLESTRMLEASLEKAKQPSSASAAFEEFQIWLQVPSFPRARPRMCHREVWDAALNLIEAHSRTLSSFRRIKL
jgi:hypothetical protein